MFSLHDFVMDTLDKMIGEEADYKVMQYSLNWYNKDVLKDEDLAYIQTKIDEKNKLRAEQEIINNEMNKNTI